MSADKKTELFVAWLRDAHAMERGFETALGTHADHARPEPMLYERLRQHQRETRRHVELLESALARHGADRSALKDLAGRVQAGLQARIAGAGADTMVKETLGGIAAEHFEIACYRSLQTAARELGDEETARMCDEILRDEESMARFLEEQLPSATKAELAAAT